MEKRQVRGIYDEVGIQMGIESSILSEKFNMEDKFTRSEHNLESCWAAKTAGFRILCLPPNYDKLIQTKKPTNKLMFGGFFVIIKLL